VASPGIRAIGVIRGFSRSKTNAAKPMRILDIYDESMLHLCCIYPASILHLSCIYPASILHLSSFRARFSFNTCGFPQPMHRPLGSQKKSAKHRQKQMTEKWLTEKCGNRGPCRYVSVNHLSVSSLHHLPTCLDPVLILASSCLHPGCFLPCRPPRKRGEYREIGK
jgi:hypothetical protein